MNSSMNIFTIAHLRELKRSMRIENSPKIIYTDYLNGLGVQKKTHRKKRINKKYKKKYGCESTAMYMKETNTLIVPEYMRSAIEKETKELMSKAGVDYQYQGLQHDVMYSCLRSPINITGA